MPELPEVEVVRAGLTPLAGRRVRAVRVLHPRAVRRQLGGAAEFEGRLVGQVLAEPRRRGKYLWFPLVGTDEALLAHLGMSGQMLLSDAPGAAGADLGPHVRVVVDLDGAGPNLRFADQRTFGGLTVVDAADGVPVPVQHIARDPFDPDFDREAVTALIRGSRRGIKRVLLDQTVVSGIGNIYADEALWRAGIHYDRSADRLSRRSVETLLDSAVAVMAEALAAGGTSFDELYVNVNGQSGYFDRSLSVYGQADRPCARCGTPIRRDRFMNRSSFFCPRCQRPGRRSTAA
jgi:formamidopyrimidine-DNA glycosylase